MEQTRFFFEPVEFHLQLADFLIKPVAQLFVCQLDPRAPVREDLRQLLECLLFPLGDLMGMDESGFVLYWHKRHALRIQSLHLHGEKQKR